MRNLMMAITLIAAGLMASEVNAQAFGGLYVLDGSTAQALATTAAKMTGFTTALPSSTVDGDQSIVAAAASDNVALVPGVYLIHLDVSAIMGTADIAATFALRDGATAITGAECQLVGESATAVTATSLTFIYRPTATATLNVYVESASGTPNMTPVDAQLVVTRLK